MVQMSVSTALNLLICAHDLVSVNVNKQEMTNRRKKNVGKV